MLTLPTRMVLLLIVAVAGVAISAKGPVLEIEEVVTRYTSAGNGAGALWCYGSTVIARIGDDVYSVHSSQIRRAEAPNRVIR